MGRVKSVLTPASWPPFVNDVVTNTPTATPKFERREIEKEVAVDDVLVAHSIELCPVYDFFAPMRPVPVPGPDGRPMMKPDGTPHIAMSREPIVTGHDFVLRPSPVHLLLGPGVILDFFSQMDPADRKTYVGFIESAREA